jgi:7-carboxy-7-deazaguanine synthase
MMISEIFLSLQGEGIYQGKACIFIRLSGCNLSCSWCDTRYACSRGEEMTTDQILMRVSEENCSLICITGGEPLLQQDQLLPLLKALEDRGYIVGIETNGTIDFRVSGEYASICMDVKCPSSGETSDLSLLEQIRVTDSVKFVIKDQQDCAYAEVVIRDHPIKGTIFFSPVYGSEYTTLASFVLTHHLPVTFQMQLHKIIGVK